MSASQLTIRNSIRIANRYQCLPSGHPQFASIRRRQRPHATKGPNRNPDRRRTRRHGDDQIRRQPPGRVSRKVPPGSVTTFRSRLPSRLHLQLSKSNPATAGHQQNLLPQPLRGNPAEQQQQQRLGQHADDQEELEFKQYVSVLLQQHQQQPHEE